MTEDTGIIAFLTARLDEDEAMVAEPHIWPTTFRPERVLREVAAKRQIVFLATRLPVLTKDFDLFDNNRDGWADALKYLAAIYSDHPDYRPEWATGDETP